MSMMKQPHTIQKITITGRMKKVKGSRKPNAEKREEVCSIQCEIVLSPVYTVCVVYTFSLRIK